MTGDPPGESGHLLTINASIWKQHFESQDIQPSLLSPTITQKQIASKNVTTLSYKSVPSTMILSEQWPREEVKDTHIMRFIADEQKAGRGQRQNTWVSPQGNLYMTLLFKYPLNQMSQLPMRIGNSLARTAESYLDGQKVQLKWVNDLIINRRKTSGFLLKNEVTIGVQAVGYCQLGIGFNIKHSPSAEFTCLQAESKQQISVNQFGDRLLEELIRHLFMQELIEKELKQYESRLLYMGGQVTIFEADLKTKIAQGMFRGVDQHGHARIETAEGERVIGDGRMRERLSPSKVLDVKKVMEQL